MSKKEMQTFLSMTVIIPILLLVVSGSLVITVVTELVETGTMQCNKRILRQNNYPGINYIRSN